MSWIIPIVTASHPLICVLYYIVHLTGNRFWGVHGLLFSLLLLLFSRSVMSDSLQPHGLQHARLPCPSPPPRICSASCPLSQWCHSTISSSVIPFPSRLQFFPASGSFPMSQLFISYGQNTGASASALVLLKNIQGWFPLGLTGSISLQTKGLSRVSSKTTVQKHQFFSSVFFMVQLSHLYMAIGKAIALTIRTFVGKMMSLLINMLSRLFFKEKPSSVSWLQCALSFC